MNDFKLEDWLPQEPWQGPPLPEFLKFFWPWYKEKEEEAPPPGATIGIEVFNSQGLPVENNSPIVVNEGESYTVRVTITNLTTRAGAPWEATFGIDFAVLGATEVIVPWGRTSEYFAAEQTRALDYSMDIRFDLGGTLAAIQVNVLDPTGALVARAIEPVTIESVAIIYGAEVVIG